ncbi:DUF2207 domain-containing protein [Actinoallomurus soli]|uniref:DUF2207 domain-containing protein n=1 Tax=Actinoallomurus soli TaxID=2952535 RepID=UPI002093A9DC|nr:DUF2207 domain-containing protein [Actinoallomurus soli]MCO5974527.1 DUF2207 domain-containing protein [Actinoallomurus soli]
MIRRIATAAAAAVALLLAVPGTPAHAAAPGQAAEHIDSYSVILTPMPGGGLHVTEQIRYVFGPGEHHGIDRWIPERSRYDARHRRLMPISGFRVSSPKGPAGEATVRDDDGTVKLRIGDPHRTVTGTQTYGIDYDVDRALTHDGHGISLTWNALGSSWKVPVSRVNVKVVSPVLITSVACVAGREGSTTPCPPGTRTGAIADFSAAFLPAHSGVTIRLGLQDAMPVAPPRLVAVSAPFAMTRFTTWGLAAAGGLLVIAAWWFLPRRRSGFGRRYRVRRRFGLGRRDGHVSGFPPDDSRMRPGVAAVLAKGWRTDRHALAATLVDLAVRGHIHLKAERQTWGENEVRLTPGDAAERGLVGVERRLLNEIFRRDEAVSLDRVWTLAPQRPLYEVLERAPVDLGLYRRTPSAQALQSKLLAWSAGIAGLILLCLAATSPAFAGGGWVSLTPIVIAPAVVLMGHTVPRRASGARAEALASAWRQAVSAEPPSGDPGELTRTFPYAIAFGETARWSDAMASPAQAGGLRWFEVDRPLRPRKHRPVVVGLLQGLSAVWPQPVTSRSSRGRSRGSGGFLRGDYGGDSSFSGGGMSVGDGGGGGGGGSW